MPSEDETSGGDLIDVLARIMDANKDKEPVHQEWFIEIDRLARKLNRSWGNYTPSPLDEIEDLISEATRVTLEIPSVKVGNTK